MASSDFMAELNCSICLNKYDDPVLIRCGDSFCRRCITSNLDIQEGSRFYTCPKCWECFRHKPALLTNLKLRKIVELLYPTQLKQEETGIFCNYCIEFKIPAVRSCVLCEASLCKNHVRVHRKSEEHILINPTSSWGHTKCSLHKQLLRFYCYKDDVCICETCLLGEHREHKVELLSLTPEKKVKLENILQKLSSKRQQNVNFLQLLPEQRQELHAQAAAVKEDVKVLFDDIGEQMGILKNQCLKKISVEKKRDLDKHLSEMVYTGLSNIMTRSMAKRGFCIKDSLETSSEIPRRCSSPRPSTSTDPFFLVPEKQLKESVVKLDIRPAQAKTIKQRNSLEKDKEDQSGRSLKRKKK